MEKINSKDTEASNKFQALYGNQNKKLTTEKKDKKKSDNLSSNSSNSSSKNKNSKTIIELGRRLKNDYNNNINRKIIDENSENNTLKLPYPKNVPKNFPPPYVFQRLNLNKILTKNNQKKVRDHLDYYEQQKKLMESNGKKLEETKNELGQVKKSISEMNDEKYKIKNNIEKEKELYNGYDTKDTLNVEELAKYENRIKELDKEIYDMEEKIAQIKFNNMKFIEEYDYNLSVYDILSKNNLNAKESIVEIDKKIKVAVQHRDELKKNYNLNK